MTDSTKGFLWFDNYTKILHIGKIMIRISKNPEFYFRRVDATKRPYLRLGWMAIRF